MYVCMYLYISTLPSNYNQSVIGAASESPHWASFLVFFFSVYIFIFFSFLISLFSSLLSPCMLFVSLNALLFTFTTATLTDPNTRPSRHAGTLDKR